MFEKKGLLVILSGFSGVGKGTIVKELLKTHSDKYVLSISATTRSPRKGEEHGREYFFITKEEFEEKIAQNEFLEYATYVGNYYGTPKQYVVDNLNSGKNVFLEIEMQGALQVKERFPEALLVFVLPPCANSLVERLSARGSETKESLRNRIEQAKTETKYVEKYDYILINDVLEESVVELHNIIESEKNKTNRNINSIQKLCEDVNNIEV